MAAFRDGQLLSSTDDVLERLRETAWLGERLVNAPPENNPVAIRFFDDEGNRKPNTGEHIVLLEPVFEDETRVLPRANISVWRYEFAWVRVGQPLPVFYDRSSPE